MVRALLCHNPYIGFANFTRLKGKAVVQCQGAAQLSEVGCILPGSVKWLGNKGPTPYKGQRVGVMSHTVLYHKSLWMVVAHSPVLLSPSTTMIYEISLSAKEFLSVPLIWTITALTGT